MHEQLRSCPSGEESIAVLIPTFCEAENISELISCLTELPFVGTILIVDDNSPDGTGQIVDNWMKKDSRVFILVRTEEPGYGRALRDGIRWLLDSGATVIATMDADLSHDPSALSHMAQRLSAADLVIGSRYVVGGGILGWPRYRWALSFSANWLVRTVFGLKLKDCTSGYRLYRANCFQTLPREVFLSEGYSLLPELARRIQLDGRQIVEHPITFRNRRLGHSKMGAKQVFGGLRDLAKLWIDLQINIRDRRVPAVEKSETS